MNEMKRTKGNFEANPWVEGACELCEMRDSGSRRKDDTADMLIIRDIIDPECVGIVGRSVSRKVSLRNAVALIRAAAWGMEAVMQGRMPEDEIAKRFHDTLSSVIKAAHAKPEDAEAIKDCLNCMLAEEEDEEDDK